MRHAPGPDRVDHERRSPQRPGQARAQKHETILPGAAVLLSSEVGTGWWGGWGRMGLQLLARCSMVRSTDDEPSSAVPSSSRGGM